MGTNKELFRLYDLIQSGDVSLVARFLLNTQVDVNEVLLCKGISVLHLAVGIDPTEKSRQCTELLLKKGADPNLCNEDGITPVHIAAIWGRLENLKLLIGCGGDPSRRDMDGLSAFDYAAREQQWDVFDYFHNVVEETDDSFESMCAYSLDLEKILVTADQMVAEYQPIPDNHTSLPIRKSEMVRDWCDKNTLVMNKLYPTLLSDTFTIDNNIDWRSINLTKNMTLDLTCDTSDNKNDQTHNTSFKTCQSKVTPIEISGIQALEMTSDERTINTEPKQRFSVYENFSLPGSPNSITHRNYYTKTTLKKKEVKSFDSSGSLFTNDNSQDLDKALIVAQNKTNEWLSSSGSRISNCENHSNCKNCHSEYTSNPDLKNSYPDGKNSNSNIKNSHINCRNSHPDCKNSNIDSKHRQNDSKNCSCCKPSHCNIHNDRIESMTEVHNTRRSSASSGVSSNLSSGSIVIANVEEEYKYVDKEEDVVLIEKRLLVSSVVLPVDNESPDHTIVSIASSLPPSMEYDNNTLRAELLKLGFNAGPIQNTTKTLYLKKLQALRKNPIVATSRKGKTYSVLLEKSLRSDDWLNNLSPYIDLESKARSDFVNPNRKWREGTTKTSFTYLLLDPRATANLPARASKQSLQETWNTFVDSIFYVGKGKRSRPYSHLYQALTLWKRNFTTSPDKKVQHILDIWTNGLGVICLHVFMNVIPAEAYTYEASMIDVIGVNNLTNQKVGNYYGVVESWPLKERRMLGLYLLYRAMQIFLSEGERQLRPDDID